MENMISSKAVREFSSCAEPERGVSALREAQRDKAAVAEGNQSRFGAGAFIPKI
jgi:hypothetical protein